MKIRLPATLPPIPMNPTIDFATPADLPALVGLLSELFSLEADFQPDPERQRAGLALILEQPALGQLFVLRVNGRVAGMANALFTVSTARGGRVLLLEDVIVAAEFRGRGLGRVLVQHVLDWARDMGLHRVTLLADRDNQAALDFYDRLGFVPSNMRVLRHNLG